MIAAWGIAASAATTYAPLNAFTWFLILPILIEAKPLIDDVRLGSSAAIAGVLVLLGWAAAAAAPAYSADRQQRFVIEHVTDTATGKSSWSVLNDGAPLPDAYRAVAKWDRGTLSFSERSRLLAPAAADPSARAPAAQLISQVQNGSERTLVVRLNAN